MKWKVTYYEKWCGEIATVYLPSKRAVLEFIGEKGMGQIMSYTQVDKQPEPFEFDIEK